MRSTGSKLDELPPWVLPGLAAGISAFVFLPGLDNQLVSDDWVFVYRGAESESIEEVLGNAEQGWFKRPVIWLLSFALARVAGFETAGYHAGSFFFHFANALLLGSLLRLLLVHWCPAEDLSRRGLHLAVCAPTAFFLLYPLHHEAVFWYSSITELTAFFGRLLVLHAGVRSVYRQPGGAAWMWVTGVVAVIGIALALASKESAVVLPGELLLVIVISTWPRSGESWRSLLRPRAAWALLLLSSVATLAWLLRYRSANGLAVGQLTVLEATPGEWISRMAQGIVRAALGGPIVRDPSLLAVVAALGAAGIVLAWRRGQRLALFSSAWLMVCLLPYLCIGSVADRQARVPILHRMIGVADDRYYYSAGAACSVLGLALALWLSKELARLDRGMGRRALRCGMAVLLAGSLAGAWRLRHYERQWHAAGDVLDRARREIAFEVALPVAERELICVHTRPHSLDGRFVLRNGIAELLWLHAGHRKFGVVVPPAADSPNCTRDLYLGD